MKLLCSFRTVVKLLFYAMVALRWAEGRWGPGILTPNSLDVPKWLSRHCALLLSCNY